MDERRGPPLKDIEAVRDLFARAHDYIAQATYPGHMGMKIAEVLNFLAFQHADFKQKAEDESKRLDDMKAALSVVNVEAAQAAVDAVIVEQPEAPKA